MKKYTRWMAGCLALLLLLLSPAAAWAKPAGKMEIVYVKMQADGRVENTIIVNGFEQARDTIVDYGPYDEIINLTNSEVLEKKGDQITIKTEDFPFYYQGNVNEVSLPWIPVIRYALDGNELPPEEIVGKDGRFSMHIEIEPDKKEKAVYSDSYVLQIMVNLPGDHFEEVEAEGGVIANQGETTLITFTALPGKEAKFTLTAKGRNISIGAIQMAGLPYSMDIDMPDLSTYTEDLLLLQAAISQLTDAVSDFTGGVSSIYDAAGQLKSGARGLSDGAYALSRGMADLASGMEQYQAGLDQYVDGLQRGLGSVDIPDFDTDGLAALTDGSRQLHEGLLQLEEGMAHLGPDGGFSRGLDEVSKGAEQLSAGMDALMYGSGDQPGLLQASDAIHHALQQMADALTSGLPQPDEEALQSIADGLRQFIQGMRGFLTGLDDAVENLDPARLRTLIAGLYDLRDELRTTVHTLRNPGVDLTEEDPESNPKAFALVEVMLEEANRIETRLDAIDEAIALIEDTDHLLDAIDGMRESTLQMIAGARTVADQLGDLDLLVMLEDIGKLIEGIVILSTQYEAFNEGLHTGLTAIKKGLDNPAQDPPGLVQGLHGLQQGYAAMTGPLLRGMSAIVPGAGQLASGIALMAEMLTQAASQFDIGEALDQLIHGSGQLAAGHRSMTGGAGELRRGLERYAIGVDEYANGMVRFQNGMLALANGGGDLAAGMLTLREETSDMDTQMKEKMDEIMDDFLPEDAPMISFASAKNPKPVRVQFLYMSQPLHAPDKEVEPVAVEEDKSIWERIIDLFR